MSVIRYDEGEHPAGFVGYRVATTCGRESDYKQYYYSFREYSRSTARRLAYAHNKKLRERAEEVLKERATEGDFFARTKNKLIPFPYINITLRYYPETEYTHEYWVPYIQIGYIREDGKRAGTSVTIATNGGLERALDIACKRYRKLHQLKPREYRQLRGCLPTFDEVVRHFMAQARERGLNLKRKDLINELKGNI